MSKFLVGKTIKEIKIAEDKGAILFICDDGEHIARCDGDCCSHSWVENIDLNLLSFPAKVLSCEDKGEIETKDVGEWGDVIKFYGFKILTDKGSIDIDYRNESNGYYGGNLSWPDDKDFYGGVNDQNVSKQEWVEIK